jgi:hypothetical protein
MSGTGFKEALTGKAKDVSPLRDVSDFYANMGAEYPWMSPDYIRYHMTEAQLFGYEQHLPAIRRERAKATAWAIVDEILRRIMPAFGFKVKK